MVGPCCAECKTPILSGERYFTRNTPYDNILCGFCELSGPNLERVVGVVNNIKERVAALEGRGTPSGSESQFVERRHPAHLLIWQCPRASDGQFVVRAIENHLTYESATNRKKSIEASYPGDQVHVFFYDDNPRWEIPKLKECQ